MRHHFYAKNKNEKLKINKIKIKLTILEQFSIYLITKQYIFIIYNKINL